MVLSYIFINFLIGLLTNTLGIYIYDIAIVFVLGLGIYFKKKMYFIFLIFYFLAGKNIIYLLIESQYQQNHLHMETIIINFVLAFWLFLDLKSLNSKQND